MLILRKDVTAALDILSKAMDNYEDVLDTRENPGMPAVSDWNAIGCAELAVEDLMDRMMTQLEETRKLADARLDLLRIHHGYYLHEAPTGHIFAMPGKTEPCSDKQKYETDCGKCLRCQSISSAMPDLEALRG